MGRNKPTTLITFGLSRGCHLFGEIPLDKCSLVKLWRLNSPLKWGQTSFIVPDASAKRARLMYVTYPALFELGLLLVGVIRLCLKYKKK
jgi:hypothetical protein